MQKQNRKIYKVKGNVNHLVNSIELPETFEFTKKELAKAIVTDAGKKNTIYNASNKDEANYEKRLDKLRVSEEFVFSLNLNMYLNALHVRDFIGF